MLTGDTIVALSTAAVPAERAIVRTSGPTALATSAALAPTWTASASTAIRLPLRFAGVTCQAWVYAFLGPRSYTGEDVVEYHLPGSPVLARMLIDDLLARGLRPAEAGEFTARAYFTGRLGLTEVEGVAATIAAADAAEWAAARQLAAGELARRLRPVTDALADTLTLVELGIDFAEEDVSVLAIDEVRRRVGDAAVALAALVEVPPPAGRPVAGRPRFVLAGRPNAGKSTLLNSLAGRPRAVTSDVAGTTRDPIAAVIDLPRGQIELVDIAGVDAVPSVSAADPAEVLVERHMRSAADLAITGADGLVLVREIRDRRPDVPLPSPADLTVLTKLDLDDPAVDGDRPPAGLPVSVFSGTGLDAVRERLDELAFGRDAIPASSAGQLMLNGRHRSAIDQAARALRRSNESADPECVAADVRSALNALGTITGSVTPDDVLGRIFSGFCIGK